jgi:hypothetical protein
MPGTIHDIAALHPRIRIAELVVLLVQLPRIPVTGPPKDGSQRQVDRTLRVKHAVTAYDLSDQIVVNLDLGLLEYGRTYLRA